ncbi:unnamed protein product [Arabidopsis lyrata]|uniref:Embryo surrounding factor 1 brassicaceae domain-containing protein n=1 Tax=Arabidopsis lyrata subsp. lyrata TaxID=81972 RepID=D7KLH7_ARALL|nr:EMBRYO SURROUNDING FACTOR 1.3 [Arabidopsis lyrata subsp. lyrata]EFH66088.1 hypothetical protein ARALYDRAFT_312115 [Arabidopsis lyrata subsp. lyrata]CAH8251852.1 unnamed protein product [Arabidopsis lyrata]|eukprot:XP_002889829.1 EMBRYO SURROUNDING FACTOR 1.3 [Arabidopsis lyrata subsp. lyrata]
MVSSHTTLICIIMLSLFALHECGKMEVKEIGGSSKIYIPPCIHETCSGFSLKSDCWCCLQIKHKKDRCWKEKEFPNAKELCFDQCPKQI